MPVTILKAATIWLAIVPLAISNGILREKVFVPLIGHTAALAASGITLSALILLVAWLAAPWLGRLPARQYWMAGALWLAMTIIFELALGRLVSGKSWSELAAAYDVIGGNLWVLVLLVTLLAPRAGARLRGYP